MILTTAYFPSLLYMRLLASGENALIESCENYQKQSCRNRFRIAGDKGVQSLTMPVHFRNNMPVRDVTVDYSTPWQREHLRAVRTCYGSAPYFPYVTDRIEDLFAIREKFLLDYNMRILERLMEIMGIRTAVSFTEGFEPLEENDTRLITGRHFRDPEPETYYQVFSDRQEFIPDLSVVDYLMCEGFRG